VVQSIGYSDPKASTPKLLFMDVYARCNTPAEVRTQEAMLNQIFGAETARTIPLK
jgi:hypothetical protein